MRRCLDDDVKREEVVYSAHSRGCRCSEVLAQLLSSVFPRYQNALRQGLSTQCSAVSNFSMWWPRSKSLLFGPTNDFTLGSTIYLIIFPGKVTLSNPLWSCGSLIFIYVTFVLCCGINLMLFLYFIWDFVFIFFSVCLFWFFIFVFVFSLFLCLVLNAESKYFGFQIFHVWGGI